jgi:sugar phosphate isomerase/epimerase
LGFTAYGGENALTDALDFAIEYGLGLVQVSMDSSRYFPENMSVDHRNKIKDIYQKNNTGLCLHGPTDIPLMSRHESIRVAAVNRVLEMIDLAIDLGGEYFVFHPGRLALYSLNRKKIVFMEKALPEKYLGYFSQAINKISAHAGDKITICIENTHAVPPQFLGIIKETLQNSNLNLAWDIGHTEMLETANRNRIIQFFQDNISHVKLFHLHDVTEKGDHKTLGSGRVNLKAYLEIIDTVGADTILEIFPKSAIIKSLDCINSIKAIVEPG